MATPNVFQGTRLPEHGQRQQLQAIAQQGGVRTSALPTPGVRAEVGGAAAGVSMGSPLQRLQSMPASQEPVTAGLSVGPGDGPMQGTPMNEEVMAQLDRAQRLASLAQFAKTPHLRKIASAMLRSLAVQMTGRGM
jgi:hypothetical protein